MRIFATIIVVSVLWILVLPLYAGPVEQQNREMISLRGKLDKIGNRIFLQKEYETYQLLLLPQSVLDSLGLTLRSNDQVEVKGELRSQAILVYQITINDTTTFQRDEQGMAVVRFKGGLHVLPHKCISCRLCINQCPVGAITFVQRKAVIDPAKCIECYICMEGKPAGFKGCPVGAIQDE